MKMRINGGCTMMILVVIFGMMSMGRLRVIEASDPDILSDFLLPDGANAPVSINGSFFVFRGFRELDGNLTEVETVKVTKASMAEFGALEGLGVSYAVLQFPKGGVNPPHTHPRASELLLVYYGSLDVGFVDSTGKLFTETVQAPDLFVFPKGLIHYQINTYDNQEALAISAFGSANAGTVSVPSTLFASGISNVVLARSFKTDIQTIEKLKYAFAPHT